MIEEFELKSRIVGSFGGGIPPTVSLKWTFTAQEDLTLRQVAFASNDGGIISTDPSFTIPPVGRTSYEFLLAAQLRLIWIDLAFPLPAGKQLFWGVAGSNSQLITLIFT